MNNISSFSVLSCKDANLMDAFNKLEQGEEAISAIDGREPDECEADNTYTLLSKQYGALFKKVEATDDERDINENFSESIRNSVNAPKLNQHEKDKIYTRFGNEVGINLLASNQVAS